MADDDSDIALVGKNGEVVDAAAAVDSPYSEDGSARTSSLMLTGISSISVAFARYRFGCHRRAETGEPVDLQPMNSFERKVVRPSCS